jgi:hypothetical protein
VGLTPSSSPFDWGRLSLTPSASFFFQESCGPPPAQSSQSFAYLTYSPHCSPVWDDPASIFFTPFLLRLRLPDPLPAPPGKRVVLPVLSHLDFRGNVEYLESLVTGIDAPRLGHIEVAFSNVDTPELSKLSKFIDKIGIHRSHRRAVILSSDSAISISLIQTRAPTCLTLQLFCKTLDLQLSSISRICIHLSAFLLDVEDLHINVRRQSRWEEDSLSIEQWLEPINLFTGVK